MNVGDKKQAIILSLVAVGAIAFLGSRLIPPKLPALLRSASTGEPKSEPVAAVSTNLILAHDPFFHVRLVHRGQEPSEGEQKDQPTDHQDPNTTPITVGPLPGMPSPMVPGSALDKTSTKDQAPKNRANVTGKPMQLRLQATMTVDQGVAQMSINGGDDRTFRVGNQVVKGVSVVGIDESGVTLQRNGKALRLRVGDECSL